MAGPLKRVMVVDDHDALRRGIKALVETRPNFAVVAEAASGHAAIEEARRTTPDIAIIDYSLPELNGLDLTLALKRELPRLEILIYTMHGRDEIISGILRAGARGYVMKSDSEDHLLAALDALSLRRPYFSGAVSEALLEQFLQTSRTLTAGVLTHREREVVQLIAEGKINKQIAGALNISIKTVETHRASAMHKLKLKTTADLVRYAIRNSLIEP
ncbi:MAG TPA: response regulator transcription factor [Sphingomicrobium sp.]|jgi:DNA-binding NarL/FixJ family response regulator|nr:response regulator transcription factor [Sphingomicrobium sp.]